MKKFNIDFRLFAKVFLSVLSTLLLIVFVPNVYIIVSIIACIVCFMLIMNYVGSRSEFKFNMKPNQPTKADDFKQYQSVAVLYNACPEDKKELLIKDLDPNIQDLIRSGALC